MRNVLTDLAMAIAALPHAIHVTPYCIQAMTTVAYLECPTGLAGDMCLGALVHAGVPLDYLIDGLSRLGLSAEYQLSAELVQRNDQQATKVHVTLMAESLTPPVAPQTTLASAHPPNHSHAGADHHHHGPGGHSHSAADQPSHPGEDEIMTTPHPHGAVRHLPEIERLIQAAHLPARAEMWSLAVFRQLAVAEGAVHGIAPEQVHFHEVGATDAIVDIVGTCLGLDWLGIEQLYCSALPIGGGTVRAAHGRLPVPAPAVLKLWELRQVPIYSNGIQRELVTPTGAAIATTLATQFGDPPAMTLRQVGLGAGSQNLALPNILRLWIGETNAPATSHAAHSKPTVASTVAATPRLPQHQDTVAVLETQLDDLSPQAIGYTLDALLQAGALDVFTQAVGMKKSRPGILLTVICHPTDQATCEQIIFRETTTLGIRQTVQQRHILHRAMETIHTPYGAIRVKVARHGAEGAIINVQPEYEDCAQLAREMQQPWQEIHRLALQTWHQQTKAEI